MIKRFASIILIILSVLCISACTSLGKSSSSTFSIQFIDVGQGDSALVECDGNYMLIDGGDESAGDTVYSVLEENGIQHLNILVMSHMHADHIGGLEKALTYATTIDLTLANTTDGETDVFNKVEHELAIDGANITVPHEGDKYKLGSAEIEVIDVSAASDNDSLVLMVTYGKTKFLFTGDIEDEAQTRISDKYANDKDKEYKVDLIKLPHHGSVSPNSYDGTGSLYRFIRTFKPDYVIISVGKGNIYGHPHKKTLDLLDKADFIKKVYRTDLNGNITVRSDGKNVKVDCEKQ